MQRVSAGALTVLLLMLAVGAAAMDRKRWEALHKLKQIVLAELESLKRLEGVETDSVGAMEKAEPRSESGATLDDVWSGAKAFASGFTDATSATTILMEPMPTTSGNVTGNATMAGVGIFSAAWFHELMAKALALMPLWAWIAVMCAAGLLLLAMLVAIIVCCCYYRRDRLGGAKQRPSKGGQDRLQTLTYAGLDIEGKDQPAYGILNFSLEYSVSTGQLIVTAASCVGLPKEIKEIDPYIVINLVPNSDPKARQQTRDLLTATSEKSKVVKNSVNPAFNYVRIFKIKDKRRLKRNSVVFDIYDWDFGTRHRMIARKVLNLANLGENLDDILGRKLEFSRDLQAGLNQEPMGPGDICLSICYSTQEKHLWVNVLECKGVFLKKFDEPDLDTMPSTYVKLVMSLAGDLKRVSRSTRIIKESRNPYFNEQFVFKMELYQLQMASLRVSLVHRTETLRLKRIVGALTLSAKAEKDSIELLHWREALRNHDRPISRWHTLVTPDEERRLADMKAAEERKRLIEQEEDDAAAAAVEAAQPDQTPKK